MTPRSSRESKRAEGKRGKRVEAEKGVGRLLRHTAASRARMRRSGAKNISDENVPEEGDNAASIPTLAPKHAPPPSNREPTLKQTTSSRKRPRAEDVQEPDPLGSLSEIILGSTMSERVLNDYKELLGSVPGMTSAIAKMEGDTQRAAASLRKQIASLVKTYREMSHVAAHAPLALGVEEGESIKSRARPQLLPAKKSYDYDVVRAELEEIEASKVEVDTQLHKLITVYVRIPRSKQLV